MKERNQDNLRFKKKNIKDILGVLVKISINKILFSPIPPTFGGMKI
jgi:hypothetical protein